MKDAVDRAVWFIAVVILTVSWTVVVFDSAPHPPVYTTLLGVGILMAWRRATE